MTGVEERICLRFGLNTVSKGRMVSSVEQLPRAVDKILGQLEEVRRTFAHGLPHQRTNLRRSPPKSSHLYRLDA